MTDVGFEKDCERQVNGIRDDIEAIANGLTDKIREEIEELQEKLDMLDEEAENYDEEYDALQDEIDKLEDKLEETPETIADYFEDYLDVSYIVNGNKEYESVRVWVTIGGPSIYVDTEEAAVILNWGNTHKKAYLSYNTRDAIDDHFREWYECF